MVKALYIEGRRTGYCPEQCRNTMTVGELINFLHEYPDDLKVYLCNDNGYTYGEINDSSFTLYTDKLQFIRGTDEYLIYYDDDNGSYIVMNQDDELIGEFEDEEEMKLFCHID